VAMYHEVKHEDGKRAKKLHHLRIRKVDGGHVVTHHGHNGEAVAPMGHGYEEEPYHEKFFSPDQGQELLAHIGKHAKVKLESEEETGEAESPDYEPEGGNNRAKPAPKRSEAEEKGED